MPSDKYRLSIAAWQKNSAEERMALARQSIQEVAYRVVEATPVDTGFARGQWQPSLNAAGGQYVATPGKHGEAVDPTGGNVAAKVAAIVAGMKAGDVFYMSNNTAYIMRLEFGFAGEDKLGRSYHQAGRYFVTGTLGDWPAIVADQAEKLGIQKAG